MKKMYRYLTIGALAALASSCGGNTSVNVEYLPVQADEDEKWGLIDTKGEMLVSDEFKNAPSMVVNGYFTVEESDGISVYKADKKVHIVGDLDGLRSAGMMTEGRMPVVSKGERIRYVNEDGETLFSLEPDGGKEIVKVSPYFAEGYAQVTNSEYEYGYIDTKGKVVIPITYSMASPFRGGYAVVRKDKDDSRNYYVIDKKGETVLKLKKDYTVRLPLAGDGTVLAINDDRFSFVDIKSGEYTKLPTKVKDVNFYNKKYIIFKDDEAWGVMDRDMNLLVRTKYSELSYNGGDTFIAKSSSGKVKIINADDDEIATLEDNGDYANFKEVLSYFMGFSSNFEIINGEKKEISFYNVKGEKITRNEFYKLNVYMGGDVVSDYFDSEGAAAALAAEIDGPAVGKVRLGGTPKSYLNDAAENHRSQDTYTLPDLKGGYRYSLSGKAKDINTFFTTSQLVPDGYWHRTVYSYNPSSTIDEITLSLNTSPDDTFDRIASAFKSKIKSKGWNVEKETKAYQVYVNGQSHLLLVPYGPAGDGAKVYMYTAEYWPMRGPSLINEAISNYKNFAAKSNAPVEDIEEYSVAEYVECVDSVSADTVVVEVAQ